MVANTDSPAALDTLVGEARVWREALHDLVVRLRSDREVWEREAERLASRTRLSPSQRQRRRAHLLRLARRRGR